MKTIYYLALMIGVTTLISCSRTKNTESVIEAATVMFQAMANQDAETMLYYLNPNVFEITPRDVVKEQMESDNAQITEDWSTEFLDVKEKFEPYLHKGVEYRLISSSMKIRIQLSVAEEGEDSDMMDESSNSPDDTVPMLKKQFGEDAVEFDEDQNIVYINDEMQLYASNDPENSGWKFMMVGDRMSEKVIPEAVINKFK